MKKVIIIMINLSFIIFLNFLLQGETMKAETFYLTTPILERSSSFSQKFLYHPIGENVSPKIAWGNVPGGTKSFILTCVDQHPIAGRWVHWMILNIPVNVSNISEGASGVNMPNGSVELQNSFGNIGYGGPLPPPGSGVHTYLFTLCALNISKVKTKKTFISEVELLNIIESNIIGRATFELNCKK